MNQKPKCKLTGEDGNAFAIMGRVTTSLRRAGQRDLINEYLRRAMNGDYNNLIAVSMDYIEDSGEENEKDEL